MSRARLFALVLAALVPVAAVHAAGLIITKSSVVVADAISTINPKALPGATVDYSLLVNNSNTLIVGAPFTAVVITDTIPANTVLNTADYGGAGTGPVDFTDGNILGLLGSGVSLRFRGLADDTDGVEFWDGTSWLYHPTGGYDPNVLKIRVTLTGTQAAASTFRLRFRVRVK